MNIFEFALDFERKHQDFHLKKAQESENQRLKSVFELLAEEEAKHIKIVKKLKENKKIGQIDSEILPKAKKMMEQITSELPSNSLSKEQVDIYKKAKEMEKKSHKFYKEKSEETDNEQVSKVFKQLAKEEAKHENLMNNLIELTNKPNTWLDDAEWYHLEEY